MNNYIVASPTFFHTLRNFMVKRGDAHWTFNLIAERAAADMLAYSRRKG